MIGAGSRVVGIDLVACPPPQSPQVTVLTGDFADPALRRAALEALGGPADLLLSDMAPKLSGIKARDEARCEELLNLALQTAAEMLQPGGTMIAKAFMSEDSRRHWPSFAPASAHSISCAPTRPAPAPESCTWSRGISTRRTEAIGRLLSEPLHRYSLSSALMVRQGLWRCSSHPGHGRF